MNKEFSSFAKCSNLDEMILENNVDNWLLHDYENDNHSSSSGRKEEDKITLKCTSDNLIIKSQTKSRNILASDKKQFCNKFDTTAGDPATICYLLNKLKLIKKGSGREFHTDDNKSNAKNNSYCTEVSLESSDPITRIASKVLDAIVKIKVGLF